MFAPRTLECRPEWTGADGIRIHTISTTGAPVDRTPYLAHLAAMKTTRVADWLSTPAFAIFHDGAERRYLVLAHWDNGNELFVRVSVETEHGWVEDASRFSFCLHDLEVFRLERAAFIATMDTVSPDLAAYREAIPAGVRATPAA